MQVFGEIGVLADDGEKVQCHLCGKWFITLQSHLLRTHGVDVYRYREDFGLNATQPLCSKEFSSKMSTIHTAHLQQFAGMNKDAQRASAERQRGTKFKMRKQGIVNVQTACAATTSREAKSARAKQRWENPEYPLRVYVTSPDFKIKRIVSSKRLRDIKGRFFKPAKPTLGD